MVQPDFIPTAVRSQGTTLTDSSWIKCRLKGWCSPVEQSSDMRMRGHLDFNPVCFQTPYGTLRKSAFLRCSSSSAHLCQRMAVRRKSEVNLARKEIVCRNGFGGFLTSNSVGRNTGDSLPSPDARCACGSEKSYGKCCRRLHTAQNPAGMAEELLRARYTAYAYRLPSYIMKTTHTSLVELDRRKWKREILEFCRDYQFVGGVDIVEQQMTGPGTTRILFRANLMQRNAAISFLEMATFTREGNLWYYKSGKLVDVDDQGI